MSRLPGILREHAASALMAGWEREPLLRLHELCVEHEFDVEPVGAGLRVADCWMVYRTNTLAEIERLFMTDPAAYVERNIIAYTDGSGTTAEKPAGIGVCIFDPMLSRPVLIAQAIGKATNNAAEIHAIWAALRAYPDLHQKIKILSDSAYAIGALTQDWARNANAELIEAVRLDIASREPGIIEFEHVDGHSGHVGNEIADRLANIGRKLMSTSVVLP